MITLRHCKLGSMAFVSHVEAMRVLQRALVRAGLRVKYSQGFNPHPITYCSQPLPLGVQSTREYFTVANENMTACEIFEAFNRSVPQGMRADRVWECAENPNIAGTVTACEYRVACPQAMGRRNEIEALLRGEYRLKSLKKGVEFEQDMTAMIGAFEADAESFRVRLGAGKANLRPDRLFSDWNERFGFEIGMYDVVRTAHILDIDGKYVDADEFLELRKI